MKSDTHVTRIGIGVAMLVVPPLAWYLAQFSLPMLLGILAGLLIMAAVFAYGIHALTIQPAAAPAPAPQPEWATAPAGGPVVLVPDELGEALTGVLNRLDKIDARQRTLEAGVTRYLGQAADDDEPPAAVRPEGRKGRSPAALDASLPHASCDVGTQPDSPPNLPPSSRPSSPRRPSNRPPNAV